MFRYTLDRFLEVGNNRLKQRVENQRDDEGGSFSLLNLKRAERIPSPILPTFRTWIAYDA